MKIMIRVFTWLILGIYYLTALMVPRVVTADVSTWLKPAPTAPGAYGNWATFALNSNSWVWHRLKSGVALTNTNYVVWAPKDNFRLLGEGQFTQKSSTFDWRMIEGERWITMAREDIGKAGMTSKQMSDRMAQFPKNMNYVFAVYSPENATLTVEVQKIEKQPDGKIRVYNADFTPWHGEHWKRAQKYLKPAELTADPYRAGINPFDKFKGTNKTDNLFHNISWAAAKVVIGHAQRYYNAPISFVGHTTTRFHTETSTSGGLFTKTVTTNVWGYAMSKWYVGTPIELQPTGEMGMICVGPGATASTCDAPERIAHAGVTFMPWDGGNMPAIEDMVYKWTQTQSGFTVLFFALVIGVLTWGIASVATMGAGTTLSIAGTSISPITAGAVAGATYAVASTALHSGGGLTQLQQGFFGATGNGVLAPPTEAADASIHTKNLAQAIQQTNVGPVYGHKLTGPTRLYQGLCPEGKTVQQCKALNLDPGTMWRPDTYAEYNTVLDLRARYDKCKADGYTGTALNQCAAPKEGEWGDPALFPTP